MPPRMGGRPRRSVVRGYGARAGPLPPGIVARPRLFRLLDRLRPLTWITGPAGAGKTTLVAGWLRARRRPAVWYRMSPSDGDVAAFVDHLARAATGRGPGPGTAASGPPRRPGRDGALPLMRAEDWLRFDTFAREWFGAFFGRFRRPFVLVLDDYHEAPDAGLLHRMLPAALDVLPAHGRLIVLSRGPAPEALARAQAGGRVQSIGWDALRLTDREAAAIGRARLGASAGGAALAALQRRAGGWAAGLVLLLEHARTAGEAPGNPGGVGQDEVFRYFAAEVLDAEPDTIQALLLAAAFVPDPAARMAAEVSGLPDAGDRLARLARRNLFVERMPGPEPTFRFHPLFREFLLERARGRLDAPRLSALRERSAAILSAAGRAEEAVDLLVESGAWKALAALVAAEAPGLVARGRSRTLERWIGRLPSAVVEGHGWLQYWLGTALAERGPARGRPALERAHRLLREAGDAAGAYLAWSAVVEGYITEQGRYLPLDAWIREFAALQEQYPTFPSVEVEARATAALFTALAFRQPQHPEIARWAERALALCRQAAPGRQMITLALLANYDLWIGEHGRAAVILDRLRGLAADRHAPPLTRILAHSVEATFRWQVAEPARCLEAAAAGLALARSRHLQLLDVNLLASGVYACLTRGRLAAARAGLDRMAAVAGADGLHAAHFHFLSAWEALLRQELPRALEHARTALGLSVEAGSPFPEAWNHLGVALVEHALGRRSEAAASLARARRRAADLGSHMLAFMLGLGEAQVALDEGRLEETRSRLREAFAIGRRQGFLVARWWQPAVIARLCREALEAGIEVEYTQRLVRTHDLRPDPAPADVPTWPWAVRIQTLGRFGVTVAGRDALAGARRTPHRVLDVLKALVALGGAAPESRVADALWPASGGDRAAQALTVSVHRLRALVAHEGALELRARRLALDPHLVWVDAQAFDRLLNRAEVADREGRADDAAGLRTRALDLYQGAFLAGDADAAWAIPARERLRARFVRHTASLGRHWGAAGQWERALAVYERGLAADDVAEELYQGVIAAHLALGRRAEALATYRRCADVLRARLGLAPAGPTTRLAQAAARS